MNAREAAAALRPRLEAAGIPGEDAAFEAEYLVRTAGDLSRMQFFAGAALSADGAARLEELARRRIRREPAPYITGEREFWGLTFAVGPGVLVPRPETELLVELALREVEALPGAILVDVGTGSGAVAVAVAIGRALTPRPPLPTSRARGSEMVVSLASGPHPPAPSPDFAGEGEDGSEVAPAVTALAGVRGGRFVMGIDVSAAALDFARLNAARHRVGEAVALVRGDLATAIGRADVVLANLPYVPSGEIDALEPEVSRWEPRVALDGGGDGLTLIRRLVEDCAGRLRPRLLALEVGFGMAGAVAGLARDAGAATEVVRDLAGIERVVCARWA